MTTTQIEIVPGKFYVLDMCNGGLPVSGPFDDREAAEADRRELNNDGDCIVAQRREASDTARPRWIR